MPAASKNSTRTPTAKPTSASEWAAPVQGFLAELPSGKVARLRRTLDLTTLLKQGRIPNPLNGVIMEMIQKQKTDIDMKELDEESLRQFFSLVDDINCQCFIEPSCQQPPKRQPGQSQEQYEEAINDWMPDPGSISVEWVDMNDKMFVFAVAQGAATDLAPFRAAEVTTVAVVEPKQDVGDKT